MADEQAPPQSLRPVDGRRAPVGRGIALGVVENRRCVVVVVVRPVGDRPQRRASREHTGLGEHGHQGHEPAVAPAVQADAGGVHPHLAHEPPGTIHVVAQVLAAHMPEDGGPPVTPVARAAAVVHVEDGVAPRREHVVEHVLAVVARPPVVHVLGVARAVHEDHRRAPARRRDVRGGPVEPRRHAHAVAGGDHHDLGLDPRTPAPLLGGALGHLPERSARAVLLDIQLGRMVGRRV